MADEALLRQYLSSYKNADRTKREVLSVVQKYKSLSYRIDAFVFNNGSRKELVNLVGTIPVLYKGAYYNIPVCLWLMDTHPDNAPLCFVKPTNDMAIKTSKYVDNNGKIYLPYLHDWDKNSSLLSLLQVMIKGFGELPPVYSKPKFAEAGQPPYPVNSFMPQPPGAYYPGYPPGPYPTDGNQAPRQSIPYPPAPYPAEGSIQGAAYPGYPSYGGPPYGSPYPPATPAAYPGYPPASTQPSGSGGAGTITEEHIKASLLSAVEDKLRRRLNEQSLQSQAELETLRRTQQELNEGKTRLDQILQRLQREQAELDKNITVLKEKEAELEAGVERLAAVEGVAVDEAVVTTAPLYSQLLHAFAEEATTEDAIYYMGEALRKEVVDLDTFLKQVRVLSRKQFKLRALMHKCRQKAGLAC